MITVNPFETRLSGLKSKFEQSLPARVAAIATTLRQRQVGVEPAESLGRQFHNLAGTAGTFGFHSIAAVAEDGFDECEEMGDGQVEGELRYLWSILDELANAALPGGFHAVAIPHSPMELIAQ